MFRLRHFAIISLAMLWLGFGVLEANGGSDATGEGLMDSLCKLKSYKAGRVSSYDRSGGNADNVPITPGQTVTLAEIEGPGCITHIWFTSLSYFDARGAIQELILRMYWDGAESPCVEAPLGDFFGLGHGQIYSYACEPFAIGTYGGLNCFWRMPFARNARITITNEGEKRIGAFYYYIDYRKYTTPPESVGHFHAQYRQARPCKEGQHYTLLDAKGRGHYVGCNLSIETTGPSWWGEGDDRIFVDGEKTPSLHGTGSEDYFGGAWCYWQEFSTPYLGMPLRARWKTPRELFHYTSREDPAQKGYLIDPWRTGDLWNVYRYHIADPIPFAESIHVEIEHGHANDRADNFASVAYWYQTEPHLDPPTMPPVDQRISPPVPAKVRESGWFETEDFVYEAKVEGGSLGTQGMMWIGDIFSEGEQLVFNATKQGDKVTFILPVDADGSYVLKGDFARWKGYGQLAVDIDGKRIPGSFEGYNDGLLPVVEGASFGPVQLSKGNHEATFTVTGKAENATGYTAGIDRLRWEPAE